MACKWVILSEQQEKADVEEESHLYALLMCEKELSNKYVQTYTQSFGTGTWCYSLRCHVQDKEVAFDDPCGLLQDILSFV